MVVFEKDDRLGGLLRYGIPDFKLEKHILDRRLEQMVAEGVEVRAQRQRRRRHLRPPNCENGSTPWCCAWGPASRANCACPAPIWRASTIAMDFLPQQNRRVAGDPPLNGGRPAIHAKDKHVIVIGGGDTGSDCVGTAIRQEALSVTQLEILPQPPEGQNPETPWPFWPKIMRTSSSQEEGCQRRWSTLTKALTGTDGRVTQLARLRGRLDRRAPRAGRCRRFPAPSSRCRPTWC